MKHNLILEPTRNLPKVEFRENGQFKIEGRCFPEHPSLFFEPLFNYILNFNGKVLLNVQLEYLSTTSKKVLFELLKMMDASNNISFITINWHYDEDDDDILETAQLFEESLINRTHFKYSELYEFE